MPSDVVLSYVPPWQLEAADGIKVEHVASVGGKQQQGNIKQIILFVGKTRVLMKDDYARTLDIRRATMMTEWAIILQCVWRASDSRRSYKIKRDGYMKLQHELHATLGRMIVAQQADTTELNIAREDMHSYVEAAKKELAAEQAERQAVHMEDLYAQLIMDATAAQRFSKEKEECIQVAQLAYEKYQAILAQFQELQESSAAEREALEIGRESSEAAQSVPAESQASRPVKFRFSVRSVRNTGSDTKACFKTRCYKQPVRLPKD